jgi:hypothetical protein
LPRHDDPTSGKKAKVILDLTHDVARPARGDQV